MLTFAPFTLPGFLQAAQASPVLYLCAAISGVANGLYFLGLRAAYHAAPASAVYPMVRSSPLLIAVVETLSFASSRANLPSCPGLPSSGAHCRNPASSFRLDHGR